jgi:ribA/ribD-fused uncharacterized protein
MIETSPNVFETDQYVFFWRGWPSQWFPSRFRDKAGNEYSHMEQYMMAEKARKFGDTETLKKIMAATNPRLQKDLGRDVSPYVDSVWAAEREAAVYRGNVLKFGVLHDFKKKLLATGDKWMVEASPKDSIWGIGLDKDDAVKTPEAEWPGKNLLGIALMRVRYHFKTGNDGCGVDVNGLLRRPGNRA